MESDQDLFGWMTWAVMVPRPGLHNATTKDGEFITVVMVRTPGSIVIPMVCNLILCGKTFSIVFDKYK